MKIQCENESCKNDIYIEENITCPSCKQIQKKKLMIKPLVMGTTLALISAYSAYEISSKLHSSTKRYPVKTEFSIINHCINGDNTLQYIKDLTVKKISVLKLIIKQYKMLNLMILKKIIRYLQNYFERILIEFTLNEIII